MLPIEPRTLHDPKAIAARRSMLREPHIAPLSDFAASLRTKDQDAYVPDFDPLDGGVGAKILFLMEKPGPMTDHTKVGRRVGSGFVSRDNDDPTAEAVWHFMVEAGIERKLSVIWNAIPWWNKKRGITRDEQVAGIAQLLPLISLLPDLRVVVGVGRRAEEAKAVVERSGLQFINSAHPSPVVRGTRPTTWRAIPQQWARALSYL